MTQPIPPANLLRQVANDASAEDFVGSFDQLRQVVPAYLAKADCELSQFENLLDLGCGLGRLLFALRPLLGPNQSVKGCDVNGDCVRWCQKNVDFADVAHTSIHPPLPYQDRAFDLVSAVSVFTHLDLDMQFQWAREVYRILRPGGVLFATLHGPFFFPSFFSAPSPSNRVAGSNYLAALTTDLAEHKGEAVATIRSRVRAGVAPEDASITWRLASAFSSC